MGIGKLQMRMLTGTACGLWMVFAAALSAQTDPVFADSPTLRGIAPAEPVVVVELYTSQGCSSCPPADEYMETLVQDPRVIALALHVDYWDYIGWKDRFASPAFTERQKSYARAIGSRMVYTPQTIVGGQERVEGHRPAELMGLIRKHSAAPAAVTLWLHREGDRLTIRAEADPPLTDAVRVQLVQYRPRDTVEIRHGENAGKTLTYHNIVTDWQVLAEWSGTEPLLLEAGAAGSDPMVVILQSGSPRATGPGNIVAAGLVK